MRALFVLLTFINIFSLSFAQDLDELLEEISPKTTLSNQQLKHLKEELKVQKLIIEEVQSLRMQGVTFANLDTPKSINTIQQMLIRSIEAKEASIKEELKDVIQKGVNKENLKQTVKKFKGFLGNIAKAQGTKMTTIVRRFGLDVGLVYLLSMQVDYTLPMVMTALGQPQYMVLLNIPVSSMTTASYVAIKKAIKFKSIMRAFGGKAKTINFYKQFFKVKKFFNQKIFSTYDLIQFNMNGRTIVATANYQSIVGKALSKLGWNKQLNYTNLLRYLEENNLMSDFIENIKATSRPDRVKLFRILNRIELTQDEKLMVALKKKFGKYINEVDHFADFPQFKRWSIEAANSTSMERFIAKLATIPEDVPPKVFDRVWRNYILPGASKNIRPYMSVQIAKSFTKMVDQYNLRMLPNLGRDFGSNMLDYKRSLVQYFYDTISPGIICGELFRIKSGPPLVFY